MKQNRREDAVSEVIGEVLIIALVVTLAAIIGAMVFGLVGNIQKTTVVGVTATRADPGFVTVTYSGGERQDQLNYLTITVNGTASRTMGFVAGTRSLDVGNSTTMRAPVPGNDHVIVVGNFADGTQQLVLDTIV